MSVVTKDLMEFYSWLSKLIGVLVAAFSAGFAAFQYWRDVRRRTAESLLEIEKRFDTLTDIARLIDPASRLYETDLRPIVEESVKPTGRTRSPDEHKRIMRLDEFLRFLLLLTRLEKNLFVSRTEVVTMYHYWFDAVAQNEHLMGYVKKYYKNLSEFLNKNREWFRPNP